MSLKVITMRGRRPVRNQMMTLLSQRQRKLSWMVFKIWHTVAWISRCAMVFGGVVSRDGLELGCIGAPGYRAHRSVAMAPMFKGIRFDRHHFCSEV